MSKDTNRVLGHADEADGIEEYDNPLPDWWIGLFWFTIVWAVLYTAHYHFIADRSQEKHLAAEMAAADERWPEQAGAGLALEFTDAAIEGGEGVFAQSCSACHGPDLQGGIGPSFLDDEWMHGGSGEDVLRTIREGVPAKGMVAWQGILSPEQISQVAAYVLSKHSEATGRSLEDILSPAGATDASAPDPSSEPRTGSAGAGG